MKLFRGALVQKFACGFRLDQEAPAKPTVTDLVKCPKCGGSFAPKAAPDVLPSIVSCPTCRAAVNLNDLPAAISQADNDEIVKQKGGTVVKFSVEG